jgi:hypothetical protein
LLGARERLAELVAKIILVAPGKLCEPLRGLATGKILLITDHDAADVAATYGLFELDPIGGTTGAWIP